MFTGIVEAVGTVVDTELRDGDLSLRVDVGDLSLSDVGNGDSIAVSGVCLTVVEIDAPCVRFDVSRETVDRTAFGELDAGTRMNLEKALPASGRFGGHIVSGHVDGVGELMTRFPDGRSTRMQFVAPVELGRYLAAKGSITIDGVSLTINDVTDAREGTLFSVNLVPHTLEVTTLGDFEPGQKVHLEVDMIARYLERLMAPESDK